ncbi:MAG: transposase domain-containing protein [Hyphomicrobiales bacterium]|nr:transposase domain-containing protein [Hyphomicrobiales bacterium]
MFPTTAARKSPASPIAIEVVRRIDALFAIESDINGKRPEERVAVRRASSRLERLGIVGRSPSMLSLLATARLNDVDLNGWLTQTLERIAAGWLNKDIDPLLPQNFSSSRWTLRAHAGRVHSFVAIRCRPQAAAF